MTRRFLLLRGSLMPGGYPDLREACIRFCQGERKVPRSAGQRRARLALLAGALLIVVVAAGAALRGDGPAPGVPLVPTPPGGEGDGSPVPDPFAYDPDDEAARVARWRPQVEAAARSAGVEPDLLEGLVFLESAGREDAVAGDLEGAVGLTQILAETGTNLLGMHVDVDRSKRLTRRIDRALRRGRLLGVQRLRSERRRVDERFDPVKALAGTARYLTIARERLGRDDLAFVSYHMGIGNLQGVLRAYGAERPSYARVYFDSTPDRHPAVQRRLAAFGDDSSNYLWKLYAARAIMRLHREDGTELARLQRLQTAKNSAEEVLHPPESTSRFGTPAALRAAWDDDEIRAFPNDPARTGLARDPRMGELAKR